MTFTTRLRKYRENLELTKKAIAKELGMSDSFYSRIETGKAEPSKNFMTALIAHSGKNEDYWIYGDSDFESYIDNRQLFKSCMKVAEQIFSCDLQNDIFKDREENGDIIVKKGSIEYLAVLGLISDIEHMKILKEKTSTKESDEIKEQ